MRIDIKTTCSCSTLLCFKWCSRTTGTPSAEDVMKTAVPETRGGLRRSTSSKKSVSGNEPAWRMFVSIIRPRFHVLIRVYTPTATAIGNQPPSRIFVAFDRDYVRRMKVERGYAVNPWATHSRFVVSHHLLRDEEYAATLRDWLLELDWEQWDRQIEADSAAGKLDALAEKARSDYTAGRTRRI